MSEFRANFIEMDMTSRLRSYFGSLFDKTNSRIMQAARHGVSEAVNVVRNKTLQNVRSIPYNMTGPTKMYGVPLIAGVKAYMHRGEATGFVDVLGNRQTNDGTWMLRFFAGKGTKRRKTRNGANRGSIKGYYSLSNAAASIGSDAATIISRSIQEAIDEINKS